MIRRHIYLSAYVYIYIYDKEKPPNKSCKVFVLQGKHIIYIYEYNVICYRLTVYVFKIFHCHNQGICSAHQGIAFCPLQSGENERTKIQALAEEGHIWPPNKTKNRSTYVKYYERLKTNPKIAAKCCFSFRKMLFFIEFGIQTIFFDERVVP